MRISWINDVSGSIWPTRVQLWLEARMDKAVQGVVHLTTLILDPQQRICLIDPPDSLAVLRKGIFELFSCAYKDARSAAATLLPGMKEGNELWSEPISSAVLVQRRTTS